MKAFGTYEEYKAKVKEFKSAHRKPLSNCFLLPAQVRELVDEGCLFFVESDSCLAILRRYETHFQVMVYADAARAELPEFDGGLSYVSELPCRVETADADLPECEKRIVALLEGAGFVLERKSVKLSRSRDAEISRFDLPESFAIARCPKTLAGEALSLILSTFDPLFAFMPTQIEWNQAIDDGDVLACVDADGMLAGAIFFESKGGKSNIRHMVVSDGYRGKGLGKALVSSYLSAAPEDIGRFELWTSADNAGAIKMYQGNGYSFDGLIAVELTRRA